MATRTDNDTDTDVRPDQGGMRGMLDELPLDRLKDEAKHGLSSLGTWAVQSAGDRISKATSKLDDVASGGSIGGSVLTGAAKGGIPGAFKGAVSGVKDKVVGAFGGGSKGGDGKGDKATKATNIIEQIDIGAPIDVVYNQWTQFQDFSNFMKKVESVEQKADEKVDFKAQIFWSHRTWSATIIDQVPDQQIVWRSSGPKGHVDGAVTFHELAPRLTRVVVVLEYYPQGLFERTGNIWRAQGRRARLELKHFRRHVMMNLLQDPDQVEGWRGEIHDSQVEVTDEEAREREAEEAENEDEDYAEGDEAEGDEAEGDEAEGDEAEGDEYEDEPAEEGEEDLADDEADEYEDEDEAAEEGEEDLAEEDEDDLAEDEELAEDEDEPAAEDEAEEDEDEPAEEEDEEDEALAEEEPAEEEEPADEEPKPRRRRRSRT
ncbi:SRPBCC family protein [Jiangella ureilytica]|uniref:SRPBCC family protein n=1 Tax=Jiangella ureilytica TaxID=2530374 RepID=UPI00193D6B86|nr:SRPBCC family protein [Jiangella ureilytica]